MKNKKELYKPGTIVRFSFQWFGRENPHDGHECRVIESKIEVRGVRNTKYFRYVLEDLQPLPARAKKIFKTTDSSANGTWLTPLPKFSAPAPHASQV